MSRKNGGATTSLRDTFSVAAQFTAHATGHPVAFLGAALVIVVWAVTGPLFGYSDTWQLVINTGTTIVTFLMVFLIQNTQNRDTLALQLKLSELVLAVEGADNKYAELENLTDKDLEEMHLDSMRRAEQALKTLHTRRGAGKPKTGAVRHKASPKPRRGGRKAA